VKRLALLAAVVAVMAFGASATAAAASNGNPSPGCQSSTWDVTVSFGGDVFPGQVMNPLVRCHPTAGSKGEWTLSGTATLAGGCTAEISGTFKANAIDMTWDLSAGTCGLDETATFTGTLNYDDGTGGGAFNDSAFGPGTWSATRTS
jgi:hypothetical protein